MNRNVSRCHGNWESLDPPFIVRSAAVRPVHGVWAAIINLECDQELAAGSGGFRSVVK